jgi:hypothetical protein
MYELNNDKVYWWRPLDKAELETRGRILLAAYRAIHVSGFRSASPGNEPARTGAARGAQSRHRLHQCGRGLTRLLHLIKADNEDR